MGVWFRQLRALFWKNLIVLSKHPLLNLLRCFILPVAYGVFLAVAQLFLLKPNNYGIGEPVRVRRLQDAFDGSLALIWADGTNGTASNLSPSDIITRISSGFNDRQRAAIKQVDRPEDIPAACPQNFNLYSECFAAVAFSSIPEAGNVSNPIRYTIRADGGLFYINVVDHTSDFEQRVLPLQWAIDQAIISAQTGVDLPTPTEWPFTQETNEEQDTRIRLSYIRGLRTLLVLALFVCFVGIAYQLPGAVAAERANLLSPHMKAMGLRDSAKVISWHLCLSLVYLPAWVIVSLTWRYRIFTETHVLYTLALHILLGLVLASWSFFIAAPFGKSPQLAAVASTLLSIVFAILALVMSRARTGIAFIFSIIFPPSFYIFAIRAICGWENHLLPTNALKGDPDSDMRLLPLLIAAVIDVFLWPWLAIIWEKHMYDARNDNAPSRWKFWKRRSTMVNEAPVPSDVAISIRGLNKTFVTSRFRPKDNTVVAVEDITLDIPKFGIFVLLGANGAGKSTILSILGGLAGLSRGSVIYEGNTTKRTPGLMGIVPQKNVLFPELTCLQTLQVWRAIKWSGNSDADEDLVQLLKDCDLESKIHANADTLSGGQKRKLQLAIGLVGGSKVVLVDECTSGVDPLSRRALWRTLTSFRQERTIIFTTHFLDEADLLADNIAILGAPGKLLAHGSPVALKRDLGEGYTIHVAFHPHEGSSIKNPSQELLHRLQAHAPGTYSSSAGPHQTAYHLKCKDTAVVQRALQLVEQERSNLGVASYEVLGTSIEDIFLDLMGRENMYGDDEPPTPDGSDISHSADPIKLSSGRATSPLQQALTIFYKRCLIVRRSWLTPLLAVVLAVAASTIPLVFIKGRQPSCVRTFREGFSNPLFIAESPILWGANNESFSLLHTPPGILSSLGPVMGLVRYQQAIPDETSFMEAIRNNYRSYSIGGVSINTETRDSLIAWEASSPGFTGATLLNLASNIQYNLALNASGDTAAPSRIQASYDAFPPIAAGTLFALKWVAFFGIAMAVYPAFFALYASKERRSSVQAMQFSNGLSNPLGLWIGHLFFDMIFSVISATIIIVIFAAVSNQFHGLGLFWVVLILYGIASTLFAYCASLMVSSPLAAFAAVAGYQVVIFLLYLAAYLLTLTYAKTSDAGDIITRIHFTMSLLSPVCSVLRAAFVSVNLFSLLCTGDTAVTTGQIGVIMRYGGPILYLIIMSFVLLGVLVWVDSGSVLPRRLLSRNRKSIEAITNEKSAGKEDVLEEEQKANSSEDALRVLGVSKTYGKKRVVDDVSLTVPANTVFALLGPNGAGKTTTFNLIRGDTLPDDGDIVVGGSSVIRHPQAARFSLGVCPQFTAIDSQLTVREHLVVYGRLKGLRREQLDHSVQSLLVATRLIGYADRLANKLSGGNQRKLSLAIALLGNPPVVLIDEFSTGVDAKMKREMWKTLQNVSHGKAFIVTTHSMEEASALANKVGILAKRLLAVGSVESLSARYSTYEIHFTCRTREEIIQAQTVMSHIPNSRMADDVATRFEVPLDSLTLADLFGILSEHGTFAEYTVERGTLESVFLKVIRENKVSEQDENDRKEWWKRLF